MSDRGVRRFALFEYGFRIFFLLAPLYGAVAIAIWVPVYLGWIALPASVEPVWLHAHEMIWGFAEAGLAGFFLTAVPSWTGAPARHGAPLIALAAIWLLGRVAMATIGLVPPAIAALIDLAFLPALALAVIGPLLAAGRARNLMLLVPLALFWAGDVAMQAEFLGLTANTAAAGARAGIDVLLLLITVIGGRIVPTFTANALNALGLAPPRSFAMLDRLAIGAMALFLLSEAASAPDVAIGLIALAAAILNGARLALWGGGRTLFSPILWVMHLGYLWLVVGLLLKAAAFLTETIAETAALHALTIGAIGTMLFAVMSRAGLGHTGRPLRAHPLTVLAYVLISAAAFLRILATFVPDEMPPLLISAGIAWTVACLAFLVVYAPILTMASVDRDAG
jgi:uncharacterized protein involved in response to NO